MTDFNHPFSRLESRQAKLAREMAHKPLKPVGSQKILDAMAIGSTPIPLVGDVAGLAADFNMFKNEPESRTPLNFGLSALGLLPFIPGAAGRVVFHGSPHKFSKFDHRMMGSGEGAQAYGWGTYLADEPEVARMYQRFFGQRGADWTDPQHTAFDVLNRAGGDRAAALDDLRRTERAQKLQMGKVNNEVTEAINLLERGETPSPKLNEANFYEVDLPDDQIAKMLDWDAPLSKQPENVKKALKELPDPKLRNRIFGGTNVPGVELKGSEIYGEISDYMAGGRSTDMYAPAGRGQQAASEELNFLGIPGIKYFDGSSRAAGEGTRNYVVFDENVMNILKRNDELIDAMKKR